jgi:hypothetical protein
LTWGLIALTLIACGTSEQLATSTPVEPTQSPAEATAPNDAQTQPIPPIYVTIAGHIEDTPIYAQCDAYPGFRGKLLAFAETFSQTGAAFNLQIEYEFFLGASQCETDEMRTSTGGRNVIDYLATHSDYTWYPEILTLAVSRDHHLGDFSRDDIACGIWIPKGANENFWVHAPGERMVYVGPGEHANWKPDRQYLSTPEFVRTLADQLEQGTLPRDRMYTASIAVPQSVIFDPKGHRDLLTLLDQLAPLIESGRAVYVTYSQAVDIWRTEYGARPNLFYREGIDPPNAK